MKFLAAISAFLFLSVGCVQPAATPVPETIVIGSKVLPKSANTVRADMAYYAIQSEHWNCQASLDAVAGRTYGVSFLAHTFGDSIACLLRHIAQMTLEVLEVHMVNETCQTNKNCGPYEFFSNSADFKNRIASGDFVTIQFLQNYAVSIKESLIDKLQPHVKCYINVGLESHLDTATGEKLINYLRPIFEPRCRMVWNGDGLVPNTVKEGHGISPNISPPCMPDLDGQDINFPGHARGGNAVSVADVKNYLNKYAACDARWLWISEFNCRLPGTPPDPRERTTCGDYETFKAVADMFGTAYPNLPPAPVVPATVKTLTEEQRAAWESLSWQVTVGWIQLWQADLEFNHLYPHLSARDGVRDSLDEQVRKGWIPQWAADAEFNRLYGAPVPSLPPAGTGAGTTGCAAFNSVSDGAKKNFVWKQSDGRKIVALLLPTSFNSRKFSSVYVLGSNGVKVDTFKYAYPYSEDKSNRQVWRGTLAMANYPSDVVLHADEQCWQIANPRARND